MHNFVATLSEAAKLLEALLQAPFQLCRFAEMMHIIPRCLTVATAGDAVNDAALDRLPDELGDVADDSLGEEDQRHVQVVRREAPARGRRRRSPERGEVPEGSEGRIVLGD